jgi:hypothetical protein
MLASRNWRPCRRRVCYRGLLAFLPRHPSSVLLELAEMP